MTELRFRRTAEAAVPNERCLVSPFRKHAEGWAWHMSLRRTTSRSRPLSERAAAAAAETAAGKAAAAPAKP
jgi:hypothetical protein